MRNSDDCPHDAILMPMFRNPLSQSQQTLGAFERRIAMLGMPLGALGCLLAWYAEGHNWGLGLMALGLLAGTFAVWRWPQAGAWVRTFSLVGLSAFLLYDTALRLQTNAPLVEVSFWYSCLYIMVFLAFVTHRALGVALGIWGLSAAMMLFSDERLLRFTLVSQFYLATLCQIGLIYFFARIKDSYFLMHDLAHTDPLTRLPNRRFAELYMEDLQRAGQPFALIALDIDHFKSINDRYGHETGDGVLKAVATCLKEAAENQVVARWGGEEFVVVVSDQADQLAERLRVAVATSHFAQGDSLTVSVGVAAWRNGLTPTQLFRQADQALLLAKNQGRNQVVAA